MPRRIPAVSIVAFRIGYLFSRINSLFIKGARILEFDKLREICGDYQQLNYAKGKPRNCPYVSLTYFPKGAVILPLTSAQVLDPDDLGLECWHAGLPSGDTRSEFSEQRLSCYELVMDSLTVFENNCVSAAAAGSVAHDPETVRSHAYELAFSSEDEMFHSTMYDWLIERNLADDLLEVRKECLLVSSMVLTSLVDATRIP